MSIPRELSSNSCGQPEWVEVAVAVVFRRLAESVELLVARRHAEAIRGGLWEFPGGKIDAGETAVAAALREVAEEVGIDGAAVQAAPRPLIVATDSDPSVAREKAVRLHAFLVEVGADATPRALASREVRWITVDELNSFEWPRANAAINNAIRRWHSGAAVANVDDDPAQTEQRFRA